MQVIFQEIKANPYIGVRHCKCKVRLFDNQYDFTDMGA